MAAEADNWTMGAICALIAVAALVAIVAIHFHAMRNGKLDSLRIDQNRVPEGVVAKKEIET